MNQSEFLAITCDLLQGARKIARTRCDWFWFRFSSVEKLARDFAVDHHALQLQSQSRNCVQQPIENYSRESSVITYPKQYA